MKWPKYKKHYRKEWEEKPEFKGWLTGDGDSARCQLCKADLRPQLADLKKHAAGKKHLGLVRASQYQPKVSQTLKSFQDLPLGKKKRIEIRVAFQTAVCSSFRSIDSLGSILEQEMGKNCFQMHRTKCMGIVKNLLGPHFKEELKKDLQDTPFSLMIDGSTDVATTKLLGVSVKYFSNAEERIISTFLTLIELKQGDAIGLEREISTILDEWSLQGKNLVGVATDGENVMCGSKHSLFTLLKHNLPHIVHLKCICHSIDLIAHHAVKSAMPSNIEYLVRESHNWFSHSAVRLSAYHEIAQLVGFTARFEDDDIEAEEEGGSESEDKTPPRLISPCNTRWLILADCIEKILGQFSALKAHFQIAYVKDRCHQAKILHEMYSDERNYLYLLFLFPILKELRRLNKLFQSNSSDILRVFEELEAAFLAFSRRILKPAIVSSNSTNELAKLNIESEFCLLDHESVDLGSSFIQRLDKSSLSSHEKRDMKLRGKQFLKDIFSGFQERLSGSLSDMAKIRCFALDKFSSSTLSADNFCAPFFPQDQPSLSEIEENSKLLKASRFSQDSTEAFWTAVHLHRDSSGFYPFRKLTDGEFNLIFSQITTSKWSTISETVKRIAQNLRIVQKLIFDV